MRAAARRVVGFYWGDGIADDVPALTYYLVLSLGPLILGLAALEALLLQDYLSALDVVRQVNRFLPDSVHGDVEQLVLGTREDSTWLLLLAIASMLWTTSGAIGVLERCLSRILDCQRHSIVVGRLRNLALGVGVAAMLVLAAAGTPALGEVADVLSLRGRLPGAFFILETVGFVVVLGAIYRYAPLYTMSWRASLLGAIPAGVGVQVVPSVIGAYVEAAAGFAAARLFLALAVVLFGLYLMALFLLVGAGLAARIECAMEHREAGSTPRAPEEGLRTPRPPVPGRSDRVREPA
ncbi:YhjD/YihY/BrkB family envelope integrity protein [Conexibacter sp. SYSU D00693]|uniref:YhjD/YihY/BrkB family envelope integrity protein n=1 Tax=Conexibacter sp. SYSU D00693 TaxID=2812560 RepID=UPI00196A6F6B|nr:YhjD/YihY/BrkB family envelope integrity protein [Conexibacter sp. SYSU D00693]